MKKLFLSAAAVAVIFSGALQANTDRKDLVKNEMAYQAKQHKVAPKEVILGLQNSYKAIASLQANKVDDAKKELKTAMDNFNKALKANPKLDFIPVDERMQAFAFLGTPDDIKKALNLGQKLLKEHDTQRAIDLISPLKDELDLYIVSIPMKIYPATIQKALDALNKGDKAGAYKLLASAMNSMVITKTVIPTPLLVAQDFVLSASKLDKKKKEEATKLLEAAKYALVRAELLGYTKLFPKEYANLTSSINAIEKEIKGKNEVKKLYDKLKGDFDSLINKVRGSKVKMKEHQEAVKKVQTFEQKENQKAVKEKSEFQKEALQGEKKAVK